MESNGKRYGRSKHTRMRYDTQKFVHAGPGNRPRSAALGQLRQQSPCRSVMTGRDDFRVDEDVRIDSLHLTAVHQIEEVVAVEEIHARPFDSLPATEHQRLTLCLLRRECLPQEVIGHSLKRLAFMSGFRLDAFQ